MMFDNTSFKVRRSAPIFEAWGATRLYLLPAIGSGTPIVLEGETALKLWEATAEYHDIESIANYLAATFSTKAESIWEEICLALDRMIKAGLLIEI